MRRRTRTLVTAFGLAVAAMLLATPAAVDAQTQWVMPRMPDGTPDLQGNWSNATMTPIVRPRGIGPVLSPEQVASLEQGRQDFIEQDALASDPDRDAPPVGGELTGNPVFDAATGGTGGYNQFFVDAGDDVAVFGGEPRSSLLMSNDGQPPARTEEARRRAAVRTAFRRQFGAYDNPENRPIAERCIMSFGSNGGPPMTPNYFYNNNYTIVQSPDAIMIMTEMVHDVRIIRMGEPRPLPDHIRPWMGDSWGEWLGDTLVVTTRNIHPDQSLLAMSAASFTPSEEITVTERFVRVADDLIEYSFTIDDPLLFEAPMYGEIPFRSLEGQVYEYACHEANYAMENVLRGARAEEARDEGEPDSRRRER